MYNLHSWFYQPLPGLGENFLKDVTYVAHITTTAVVLYTVCFTTKYLANTCLH